MNRMSERQIMTVEAGLIGLGLGLISPWAL